ncbi:MAG: HPr(Ser) kinase/phosphatase [Clostridia bacterium]|nr:HPr(Ser) kinase/phosphatase [Clostridia bacterium]
MDFEELNSISLSEIIDHFKLEIICSPLNLSERVITSRDVTRPGLPLAGFYEHMDTKRIGIIGNAEHQYLSSKDSAERYKSLSTYFSYHPAAIIFSSNNEIFEEAIRAAEEYDIPILRTGERTSALSAALVAWLNVKLAPRITRHGVLVEVYGEGILILGDSGVGKSETAIELVKRGHRLIADDAVEIKRVSSTTLVGSAPEIIRHYVELRGIGIVDVRRIFGMGAVKETEKIDMIINLEPWVQGKMYDRLGLDQETTDIMGIAVPTTTIPVKPGRNLAIIMEIAAMNNRQKKMGYNTAEEFNKRLMAQMGVEE